jgi:hypothetical protein
MARPLSFGVLRTILMDACHQLPDVRTGDNGHYSIADAALGAFSVFFMQCPSFLAYQRDMQRRKGCNNAHSLFGVAEIPSDQQIRNLLDPIAPQHLYEPFWAIQERLMEDPANAAAFDWHGQWLLSLDGTGYFHSLLVHCAQCTVTQHDGARHYAHQVLLPVLVKPGEKTVLVLDPEFIVPQDGTEKQDCERRAAQRWIERAAPRFTERRVTILGDDLYCHQPFCELLLAHHLDFILTCKPESHPTLYEEVALLDKMGAVTSLKERVWVGPGYDCWHYRFVSHVPLREPLDPLYVQWCELTVTDEATGKERYHNALATNQLLAPQTVPRVTAAGRARWKVENEGHNVLKHQGYHLEHNYGHGKEHLSTVLVTLILLAFLFHTALQLVDQAYVRVRAELGPRRTFFNDLRALTRYLYFDDWDRLMAFMMAGLELAPG